jgi:hypothetical protein
MKNLDLEQFEGKRVLVRAIDGDVFTAEVINFNYAGEDDSIKEDMLSFDIDGRRTGRTIPKSHIKEIEIINSNQPTNA